MWRLSKFSIDGKNNPDVPEIEGYTDNSTWNGWASIACTRNQIVDWLEKTGNKFEIIEPSEETEVEYPILILFWDEYEIIESSPLWIEGEFKEVYFLDGWCWVELED